MFKPHNGRAMRQRGTRACKFLLVATPRARGGASEPGEGEGLLAAPQQPTAAAATDDWVPRVPCRQVYVDLNTAPGEPLW